MRRVLRGFTLGAEAAAHGVEAIITEVAWEIARGEPEASMRYRQTREYGFRDTTDAALHVPHIKMIGVPAGTPAD
jgi:hypothetical protein